MAKKARVDNAVYVRVREGSKCETVTPQELEPLR